MSTRMRLGMVAVVCFAMMLVWTTSASAFEKTYNVGNRVWLDLDAMGDQDATGETGFDGVTVTLSGTKSADGSALTIVMNTTTAALANLPQATPAGDVVDGHGCYNFNVPAGTYTITVDAVNTLSLETLEPSGPSPLVGLTQTYDLNGALDNSATVTVTDANIYNVDFGYYTPDDDRPFTTYTQGGWGAKPSGNNPGAVLRDNWLKVYPTSTLSIGSPNSLVFTDFPQITNFLPQGGTAGALKRSYYFATETVKKTEAGVLAGQVVALQLNVDFSNRGVTTFGLAGLTIQDGPFAAENMTVATFLTLAKRALGGGDLGIYTFAQFNDTATRINENFDNGTTDLGFLK